MTELICIVCPKGCHLQVEEESLTVTGAGCAKGVAYGKVELSNPTRVLTSTVILEGGLYARCPVKTSGAIPKRLIFEAMRTLEGLTLIAPVTLGQVAVKNVCGTGMDFVCTRAIGEAP